MMTRGARRLGWTATALLLALLQAQPGRAATGESTLAQARRAAAEGKQLLDAAQGAGTAAAYDQALARLDEAQRLYQSLGRPPQDELENVTAMLFWARKMRPLDGLTWKPVTPPPAPKPKTGGGKSPGGKPTGGRPAGNKPGGERPPDPEKLAAAALEAARDYARRHPDDLLAIQSRLYEVAETHKATAAGAAAARESQSALRKLMQQGMRGGQPKTAPTVEDYAARLRPGLVAELFLGDAPDAEDAVRRYVCLAPQIDYAWRARAPAPEVPAEGYSIRWRGRIYLAQEGEYLFRLYSSGGAQLFIDGEDLLRNWELHPGAWDEARLRLYPGAHEFWLEFRDGPATPAEVRLAWRAPGAAEEALVGPEVFGHDPSAPLAAEAEKGRLLAAVPAGEAAPSDATSAPAPTGDGRAPGLVAEFFSGREFRPEKRLAVRVDAQVDFEWGEARPDPKVEADDFCVRWTGFLDVPQDGEYALGTKSDDGVRLFVDDRAVIDNWTNHGPTIDKQTLHLAAGLHPLRLEFYDSVGGATCSLAWRTPEGGAPQPIPGRCLRHSVAGAASPTLVAGAPRPRGPGTGSLLDTGPGLDAALSEVPEAQPKPNGGRPVGGTAAGETLGSFLSGGPIVSRPGAGGGAGAPAATGAAAAETGPRPGLVGEYFNGTELRESRATRVDGTVNFNWGIGRPLGEVGNDNFSARWTGVLKVSREGEYLFETTSDDGIRLMIDGQKVIENWTPHAPKADQGTLRLSAGEHKLRLEFFEQGGGATCILRWRPPGGGGAPQVIPADCLGH